MNSTLTAQLQAGQSTAEAASQTSINRFWFAWVAAVFCLPMAMPYHWLPDTSFFSNWLAVALAAVALVPGALTRLGARKVDLTVAPIGLALFALAGVIVVQQLLGLLPYVQQLVVPVGVLIIVGCVLAA